MLILGFVDRISMQRSGSNQYLGTSKRLFLAQPATKSLQELSFSEEAHTQIRYVPPDARMLEHPDQ